MGNDYSENLADFIEIGETGVLPNSIAAKRHRIEESGINRESPDFWARTCASHTVEQAIALFKGLVIAERGMGLSGGSVSGNIWVLKCLDKVLSPSQIFDLVDWAFEHRDDLADYTPLGAAIQKEDWREVDRNLLLMREGSGLDCLRARAVDIRKGRRRNRK